MQILITGGGCEEPIDGVRSICNVSSGKTAAFLCDHFVAEGFSVTAILSQRAVKPQKPVVLYSYRTFLDLSNILHQVLSQYSFDMVIHAAAVSDYSVDRVTVNGVDHIGGSVGKIESGSEVMIQLKENPKLIDGLASWSKNKACRIIGFKLTNTASGKERGVLACTLLNRTNIDFVVVNDISEIDEDWHPFCMYQKDSDDCFTCRCHGKTKQELAGILTMLANEIQGDSI